MQPLTESFFSNFFLPDNHLSIYPTLRPHKTLPLVQVTMKTDMCTILQFQGKSYQASVLLISCLLNAAGSNLPSSPPNMST